jgi:hypothetical protein
MDRTQNPESTRPRRATRGHARFAPVVWIVVLLGLWIVLVDWRTLPDLVNATMAMLP